MKNKFSYQRLLDDLETFMEVIFYYKGIRYGITYDEENAWLFEKDNPKELAVFHSDVAYKLTEVPVFDGKTLKEIWSEVEVDLI